MTAAESCHPVLRGTGVEVEAQHRVAVPAEPDDMLWISIDGIGSGRSLADWVGLVGRCNVYDHESGGPVRYRLSEEAIAAVAYASATGGPLPYLVVERDDVFGLAR